MLRGLRELLLALLAAALALLGALLAVAGLGEDGVSGWDRLLVCVLAAAVVATAVIATRAVALGQAGRAALWLALCAVGGAMLALGWFLGLREALCDAGAGCPDRPDVLLGLLVYGGLALVLTAFALSARWLWRSSRFRGAN